MLLCRIRRKRRLWTFQRRRFYFCDDSPRRGILPWVPAAVPRGGEFFILINAYVCDNKSPDTLVEPLHQLCSHQGEIAAQGGVGDFHKKSLIPNRRLARIIGHHPTGHLGPSLDKSLLKQGRFQALLAQKPLENLAQGFDLAPKHRLLLSLLPRHSLPRKVCSARPPDGGFGRDGRGWCR